MAGGLECACGFVAKSSSGLATHRRAKHPENERTNVAAVERTIEALHEAGRIEPVDAARIQLLRSLAKAVDEDPLNGSLWRQYFAALDSLMKADDAADDGLAAAVAALRGAAPLGDTPAS